MVLINEIEFVKKRRDRVLATILSYKELNIDHALTPGERDGLRRVILNNVNDFNDLVLDILKARMVEVPVQVEFNELYLQALNRIENKIDEL